MKRYLAYVASFFTKKWTLDSYPVILRQQTGPQPRGSLHPYAWTAHIDGWPMMLGCGDSSAMAREDLARNLARYGAQNPLPRPGTPVAMTFAPSRKAQSMQTFGAAFVARVFDIESIFFTDESSLWDYCPGESLDGTYRRIRELYGVDVSDIEGANLVNVLERVRAAR